MTALRLTSGLLFFLSICLYPFSFTVFDLNIQLRHEQNTIQTVSRIHPGSPKDTNIPQGKDSRQSPAKNTQPNLNHPPITNTRGGQHPGNESAQNNIPQDNTPPDASPKPAEAIAAERTEVQMPPLFHEVNAGNKVGLSFDDGPHRLLTDRYLQVLKENNVRATFFMVGSQIERYPDQARNVMAQGSEIGNHSWSHAQLDKLGPEELDHELNSVSRQVYNLTGQKPAFIRPPYGRYSKGLAATAAGTGQQLVLWDVDPRDWQGPSPGEITERVLAQVKPGSIILLHEGRQNTLEALPEIIRRLRESGLEPVPVSELFSQTGQTP